MEKREKLLKCFYVRYGYAVSWILGTLLCKIIMGDFENLIGLVVLGYVLGSVLVHPIILTMTNLAHLFVRTSDEKTLCSEKISEAITILKGAYLTFHALWIFSVERNRDLVFWIYEIFEKYYVLFIPPFFIALLLAGLSYLYLRYAEKTEEKMILVKCSCIVMCAGICISVLWVLLMLGASFYNIYLCLWPFNCILIAIKLLFQRWQEMPDYYEVV